MSQKFEPKDQTAPPEEAADTAPRPDAAPELKAEKAEDYEAQSRNYYDQLVRLQADFSNFRKRSEREKSDAIRFGRETVVERLISLLDVMDQALAHSKSSNDVENLRKGFEMVVQEFGRVLKAEGAEALNTVGQSFDPHLHEAMEQVETEEESKNNIVLEEVQKGYTLNGRLLRPARVKVARKKEQKQSAPEENA